MCSQALAAEIEFLKNQERLEELQHSSFSFKSGSSGRAEGLEYSSKPPLPPSLGESSEQKVISPKVQIRLTA